MQSLLRFIMLGMALGAGMAAEANILDIEGGEATMTGIYIKDLATDSVIVDHNSALAITPASITKAVTTATALTTLGPDFRFATTVELVGQAKRKRWSGDLVIRSSADPTLENKEFPEYMGFTDSIISALHSMGIEQIDGNIIINENLKDSGPIGNWECEDIAWPYGAGLYGFNYGANVVKAYANRATTEPASDMEIISHPSDDGTDVLRGINSNRLDVWVTDENSRKRAWNVQVAIHKPADMYVKLLTAKLRAAGIKVEGEAVEAKGDTVEVYTHLSPSALAICESLMKRSDNLFAEGMLRAIDPQGSRSDCLKKERKFLDSIGLNSKLTILLDGSGLSRANRFSPAFLGNLLEHMTETPLADDYLSTFPVAGHDGTLKRFLAKTALDGQLALKTGSMRAVQCYAGYKLDADGRPSHVVVIMVNGFFCRRAALREHIEAFLLHTFAEPQPSEPQQ